MDGETSFFASSLLQKEFAPISHLAFMIWAAKLSNLILGEQPFKLRKLSCLMLYHCDVFSLILLRPPDSLYIPIPVWNIACCVKFVSRVHTPFGSTISHSTTILSWSLGALSTHDSSQTPLWFITDFSWWFTTWGHCRPITLTAFSYQHAHVSPTFRACMAQWVNHVCMCKVVCKYCHQLDK
jgi:hypothetical protein